MFDNDNANLLSIGDAHCNIYTSYFQFKLDNLGKNYNFVSVENYENSVLVKILNLLNI
jgi:hypothetical protein